MKYSILYFNSVKALFCATLFVISITNPLKSQNQSCANAELIVPANLPQCQNSSIYGSDTPNQETNLWYKFTATSTDHSLIFTDDFHPFGFCDPTVTIYQGSCGSLQSILQVTTTPNQFIDITIADLVGNSLDIGSDYWINITCSTGISVEFCLGTLPEFSQCAGAIEISTSSEVTCAYTTPDSTTATWYKFEASSNNYKINTKVESDQEFEIAVMMGDCGPNQEVMLSEVSEFISGPEETYWQEANVIISNLTIGETYNISIIDASNYIDLCLIPTPLNDECTGAAEITLSDINDSACSPINVDLSCATQSSQSTCSGNDGLDLWYSFRPDATTIQIQAFNDYLDIDSSIRVELYTELVCDNPNNLDIVCYAVLGGRYLRSSVIPGEKYFIRIISDMPYENVSLCIYQRELPQFEPPIWTEESTSQQVYLLDNNVGINNNDPQARLDIIGNVKIDYLPESGTTQALQVLGNVSISGEMTTDSDVRYKRNIRPLHSALEFLQKLEPVIYNYNTNKFPERHFPEREKMGLLAQDVEKVLPNIITTDSDGYKSVNYTEVIPLLIQAIKEQQVEIEKMKHLIRN